MWRSMMIIFFWGTGFFSNAQDPHFSQYYAAPSTVNPANAGLYKGDMRISGLYRQQWPQYGDAFVTGTIAFEMKPRGFRDGENKNRLSLGAVFLYDRTPDAILKSQHAYAQLAYHQSLDETGHHRLGMGFMFGYNQKMLDHAQLSFGSQFGSGGFTSGSGEILNTNKISSYDLHSGLMYSYEDEKKLVYAGASAFHLLKPRDQFISAQTALDHVPMRYHINAGMNITGEQLQWAASALYMHQQGVNEWMAGGAVGIPYAKEGLLYLGVWYRLKESLIPTINLQWRTMNIGLSYDSFAGGKMARPRSFELSISTRIEKYRDYRTGCFAF
jgi:type IX secretion system PorP/SprF family membrane protein